MGQRGPGSAPRWPPLANIELMPTLGPMSVARVHEAERPGVNRGKGRGVTKPPVRRRRRRR